MTKNNKQKRHQASIAKKTAKNSRRKKALKRTQSRNNENIQRSFHQCNAYSSRRVPIIPSYNNATNGEDSYIIPFQKEIIEDLGKCFFSQTYECDNYYDFNAINMINGKCHYLCFPKLVIYKTDEGEKGVDARISYLDEQGRSISECTELTYLQTEEYIQSISASMWKYILAHNHFPRKCSSHKILRPMLSNITNGKEPLECPYEDGDIKEIINQFDIRNSYIISKSPVSFSLCWGSPKELITKIGYDLLKEQEMFNIVIGDTKALITAPCCFYEKKISALYLFFKLIIDGKPQFQVFPTEIETSEFSANEKEYNYLVYLMLMNSQCNYYEFFDQIKRGQRKEWFKSIEDFQNQMCLFDTTINQKKIQYSK